jgi:Holliday junction resolvase RusA-like endonuclease
MRPAQRVDRRTGKLIRVTDPKAEAEKKVIAQAARLAWRGDPTTGPVLLGVEAVFRIPPSWPSALREEADRGQLWHVADPDLDQLIKQVQDGLTGIVYWDDNQVVAYGPRPIKRYGSPERTVVRVEVLDQPEAAKTPGQRDLERAAATGQMIPGRARPRATPNRSKSGSPR